MTTMHILEAGLVFAAITAVTFILTAIHERDLRYKGDKQIEAMRASSKRDHAEYERQAAERTETIAALRDTLKLKDEQVRDANVLYDALREEVKHLPRHGAGGKFEKRKDIHSGSL